MGMAFVTKQVVTETKVITKGYFSTVTVVSFTERVVLIAVHK